MAGWDYTSRRERGKVGMVVVGRCCPGTDFAGRTLDPDIEVVVDVADIGLGTAGIAVDADQSSMVDHVRSLDPLVARHGGSHFCLDHHPVHDLSHVPCLDLVGCRETLPAHALGLAYHS